SAVDRKRNRALRAALRPLGRRLRQLRTMDEVWPIVVEAATALGAVSATLQVVATGGTTPTPSTYSHGATEDDATPDGSAVARFRFSVPGGRTAERTLELGWTDGRQEIDRDTEIAVDIFCEYLGEALELTRQVAVAALRAPGASPRA